MPKTHIHLISNILLIGAIYYFDKEIRNSFKKNKKTFLYFCLTIFCSNLIDIDHLLATPIYDPNRCSINFHPLHSWYTMPFWILGLFLKNKFVRYFCLGVILHLLLDLADCLLFI